MDSPQAFLFQNALQNKRISIYDITTPHDEGWGLPLAEISNTTYARLADPSRAGVDNEKSGAAQRTVDDNSDNLTVLELSYSKDELIGYTEFRKAGVS